jgi:hypothetical protein
MSSASSVIREDVMRQDAGETSSGAAGRAEPVDLLRCNNFGVPETTVASRLGEVGAGSMLREQH